MTQRDLLDILKICAHREDYDDEPAPKRDRLDRYYTPDKLAERLVGLLPLKGGQKVLEPSAGGGAFVRALWRLQSPGGERVPLYISAIDIDPDAPIFSRGVGMVNPEPGWKTPGVGLRVADFTQCFFKPGPDWIIGNPPYRHAETHIRWALKQAKVGVAFLLRLSFLESAERLAFWYESPVNDLYVLAERPSFTGQGTDSSAYAFFVWYKCAPDWRDDWADEDGPFQKIEVISWR
jgi:hypothetical protein